MGKSSEDVYQKAIHRVKRPHDEADSKAGCPQMFSIARLKKPPVRHHWQLAQTGFKKALQGLGKTSLFIDPGA